MKKKMSVLICGLLIACSSMAQEWMTSLDAAKRLALVQNKMVLMMWEGSMFYPLPVMITDENGKTYYIKNLFESIPANEIIWDYFVPVSLSEDNYEAMYAAIKGKRSQAYMDKFNDDSIKILDAAGNILNVDFSYSSYLNLSNFIAKYALDTSYLNAELKNYVKDKNFYTAYFLASKYLDYSILTNKGLRKKIINLAEIYVRESQSFLENNTVDDKSTLTERAELLELYSDLIIDKPRKVLRVVRRMEKDSVSKTNESKVAFLRYGAHLLLGDVEEAEQWKGKVATMDLRKAQLIANIHRN